MAIIDRNKALNCFKTLQRKLIDKRNALNQSIEELNKYSDDSISAIISSDYI